MLEQKHLAMLQHAKDQGNPQFDNIRACFETLALASAINGDCAARLGKHGLSEGKFVILFLLQDQPEGLSPRDLAERAGVSRATTTGLLDGLERDGFLSRQGGQKDRRTLNVRLTDHGKAKTCDLFAEHAKWITTLFANLSHQEKTTLSTLLKKAWLQTDQGLKETALRAQAPAP